MLARVASATTQRRPVRLDSSMSSVTPRTRALSSPRRPLRRGAVSRAGFGRLLVSQIDQRERSYAGRVTRAILVLMLCMAFAFLLPSTASTRTATPPLPRRAAVPMTLDGMAREVVYLVNLERAQHALPP